jgi:flagellar biosynthesis protein FlhB
MSDDGDKRFEPTPSRRRRAKREGNAPRSTELASTIAFAAAIGVATLSVPLAAAAAASALRRGAAGAGASVAVLTAAALAPACAAACAAVGIAIAQGGGLHVTPVRVDAKRLDPVAGLKRIAGAGAFVGTARALCALVVAVVAVLPAIADAIASAHHSATPSAAATLIGRAALRACVAALATGAAFALVDVVLARRRWLRGLRMSFDELKRDAKENDGDPHARARRKSAHRAVTRGGLASVREASFVVVNPTHVAVALRYAPPAVPVPEVLVRAVDEGALRVRAVARACDVPVVEDAALARALYAQGESGRAIPVELYVAVAQIIADLAREGLLA